MSVVVGLDIGGTNTRAAIAETHGGRLEPHAGFPEPVNAQVGTKEELRVFLRELLAKVAPEGEPTGATLAFAGPVERRQKVTITNWPEPREITLDDLVAWGLPSDRTVIVNDMEAGCFGLVKRLRESGAESAGFERLPGSGASSAATPGGNCVFVAPGTGLGAAGIIRRRTDAPEGISECPVAAELQHTPMPIRDKEQQEIAGWMREQLGTEHPVWEDFVSGRGLVNIYRALCAREPAGKQDIAEGGGDAAAAIADAGAGGRDATAEHALTIFYECAGRFCQLMALGFQSFGGVFLGGSSTSKNRDFILRSSFVAEFLDNPSQRELLEQFPVYLVKGGLNLDGALWLAARGPGPQE